MYSNEILEEIWAIRERFWKESGEDIGAYLQQLHEFTRTHPQPGPVLRTAEEVQRYLKFGELPSPSVVREEETKYGDGDQRSGGER